MAKNKDVIERRYLQLKLNRDGRKYAGRPSTEAGAICAYIDSLREWLAGSVKRTKKPGGIGR